jgi:replication initiation and membrane attachment protein DnaB
MSLLKLLPIEIQNIIMDYKYSMEMIHIKKKLNEEYISKIKNYIIYYKNPSIYLGFLVNYKKIIIMRLQ